MMNWSCSPVLFDIGSHELWRRPFMKTKLWKNWKSGIHSKLKNQIYGNCDYTLYTSMYSRDVWWVICYMLTFSHFFAKCLKGVNSPNTPTIIICLYKEFKCFCCFHILTIHALVLCMVKKGVVWPMLHSNICCYSNISCCKCDHSNQW